MWPILRCKMVQIALKGKPTHTVGSLPTLHTKAPEFTLVDKDLKDRSLSEFQGKWKILTTAPSFDTSTCSAMAKHFNEFAKKNPSVVVIAVSADLPFAQSRFCEAEGVHNAVILSMMRNKDFGNRYGILIADGPLAGILARSVLVLDEKDHVMHAELVAEISMEPDYRAAIDAVKAHHR